MTSLFQYRSSSYLIVLAIIFIVGLSGCQTSQINNSGSNRYHFFFTPGTHLKQLLDEGENEKASTVYLAEYAFFSAKGDKYAEDVKRLYSFLDEKFRPSIRLSLSSLNDVGELSPEPEVWEQYKSVISESQLSIDRYGLYPELEKYSAISKEYTDLVDSLAAMKARLLQQASEFFLTYHKQNVSNFFSEYPDVVSNKASFLNENRDQFGKIILLYSEENISDFLSSYDELLRKSELSELRKALAFRYSTILLSNSDGSLKSYLEIVGRVTEHGLQLPPEFRKKVAIVDGSSQSLLNAGQLEFPLSLTLDVFQDAKKMMLFDALSDKANLDYVVVFSVNAAKTLRRMMDRQSRESKYRSGTRQIQNPKYEQARMAVYQAQSSFNRADSQYCEGYGCIGKAIAVGVASGNLQNVKKVFSTTPMMLSKPTYTNYSYSSSNLTAKKLASAEYYFLDLKAKRLYSGNFSIGEEKKFNMAYGVHSSDEKRSSILTKYDHDTDVTGYEEGEQSILLSDLLSQVTSNKAKRSRLVASYPSLEKRVLADRHKAILEYKTEATDVLPENDKRMEHVVVIYNPTGSLGAGFFVKSDMVLTNYHVVEGAKFVEMKLNNGHESFGKVVKSDVRLDLALVKIQTRGKPVEFHKGKIPLGKTVEAIGHPKGYEFSITRGVVSGIRKKPSIYGTGGKDVLFVQSDTPINAGNSGGPMFLGNKVVGVNNNKMVDDGVEGLGFSIHYAEVNTFLSEDF